MMLVPLFAYPRRKSYPSDSGSFEPNGFVQNRQPGSRSGSGFPYYGFTSVSTSRLGFVYITSFSRRVDRART
jgi:hypothetical protein